MQQIAFSGKDVLVGIAASGRTPYVLGCMEYARSLQAPVIAVTCCPGSQLDRYADIGIAPTPGPEVITGSTRMKSGTAQKMVPGGDHRLYPDEVRHSTKNGAEHALHRSHD